MPAVFGEGAVYAVVAAVGAPCSGRVRDGSTLMPGPMVDASVTDLM